jgi:hypothetical protein
MTRIWLRSMHQPKPYPTIDPSHHTVLIVVVIVVAGQDGIAKTKEVPKRKTVSDASTTTPAKIAKTENCFHACHAKTENCFQPQGRQNRNLFWVASTVTATATNLLILRCAVANNDLLLALAPPTVPPAPEPPPLVAQPILHNPCPPGCLLKELTRSPLLTTLAIDLCAEQISDSFLATLPQPPSITDSVMHIVCSPCVCGVHIDRKSSITIHCNPTSTNRMIDGGSNVCMTGNLGSLLDVDGIKPCQSPHVPESLTTQ